MPDGLGELASHLDPGHLGPALAAEPTLGALVVLDVDRVLGRMDGRFDEGPTQVLGPVFGERAPPVPLTGLDDPRAQPGVADQLLG